MHEFAWHVYWCCASQQQKPEEKSNMLHQVEQTQLQVALTWYGLLPWLC